MKKKQQELFETAATRSLKQTVALDSGAAVLQDVMAQTAMMRAGAQEEYSALQTGFSSLLGGVAGGVLGSGLDYGLGKIAKKYYDPKVKKLEEDAKKSEIAAGIIAEKRLAEAREVAGTPVAKAVDNEAPASQLQSLIKDVQERADAIEDTRGQGQQYHGSSNEVVIGDGDKYVFLNQIVPDITFSGSTSVNPDVSFTVKAKNFPGANFSQTETGSTQRSATSPVEQFTEKLNFRLRGRSFALRIDSTSLGTKYKLGTPRANLREDGRR